MTAFFVSFVVLTLMQQSRARHRLQKMIGLIDKLIASSTRPTNYSPNSPGYHRAPYNINEVQT